jgi:hypothetical protein
MDNSEIKQQEMGNKKRYSAPRLVSYGSVAQLTKVKSGKKADSKGGKGDDLPVIRRY